MGRRRYRSLRFFLGALANLSWQLVLATSDGSVRFTLDSGETLIVPDEDLRVIYDELWKLAPRTGAISMAAVVLAAARQAKSRRVRVELTSSQSVVLREAVALLQAEPS